MIHKRLLVSVGCAVGALCLLAGAWDPHGLGPPLKELNQRVDRLAAILETQTNAAIRAVPGEALRQDVQNVNQPCELMKGAEKAKCESDRERSQRLLVNLSKTTGVDMSKPYEVSVWVESSDPAASLPRIDIDVFMTTIQNLRSPEAATHAQYFLDKKKFNPDGPVSANRENYRPLTSNEIEAKISAVANKLFADHFSAGVGLVGGGAGQMQLLVWKAPALEDWGRCAGVDMDCAKKAYNARSAAFVDAVRTIVMTPYGAAPIEPSGIRIFRPWDTVSAPGELIVLIKKEHYEKVKDRLKLYAWVHAKGETGDRHKLSRRYDFLVPEDFKHDGANPVDQARGEMVWAAHSMFDGLNMPQSDVLKANREELVKLRQELETAIGEKKK